MHSTVSFPLRVPLLPQYGILMMQEIVPKQKTGYWKGYPMIDRLQNVLPHLEHLPPEAQEEAATYIAALAEALEFESLAPGRKRPARW